MKTEKFRDLLKRYTEGKATQAEELLVEQWYHDERDNEDLLLFRKPGKEASLKEDIYGSLSARWHPQKSAAHRISRYIPYAAAIILFTVLSITAGYLIRHRNSESYLSYEAGTGAVRTIILPDRSRVWLNSGSRLRIGKSFGETRKREVFLDEGEAFFEVTKDKTRPFIVQMPNRLRTGVLGTSFNISAYRALPEIRVTVSTGRVEIRRKEQVLAVLNPESRIVYRRSNRQYKVEEFGSEESSSWREGRIWLRGADFNELASVMRNVYGVELRAESAEIAAYHYNLQLIASRPLEATLSVICSVHQNQHRRKNNVIEIY